MSPKLTEEIFHIDSFSIRLLADNRHDFKFAWNIACGGKSNRVRAANKVKVKVVTCSQANCTIGVVLLLVIALEICGFYYYYFHIGRFWTNTTTN